MRVWDIHPGYLSRQSLLGQHAEIHALAAVIEVGGKGYANHPETLRWRLNRGRLNKALDLTVYEMELRKFRHASPLPEAVDKPGEAHIYVDRPLAQIDILREKYHLKSQAGRIPLPKNIYQFWAHHKYSVMARGYNNYKKIQSLLNSNQAITFQPSEFILEEIMNYMKLPVNGPALVNVIDHLWGYFKKEAGAVEKEFYLSKRIADPENLLPFLYELAGKYDRPYLLHSTVFADFTTLNQGLPDCD